MNLIYLMPQLRGFRITNVRLTHDAVALAAAASRHDAGLSSADAHTGCCPRPCRKRIMNVAHWAACPWRRYAGSVSIDTSHNVSVMDPA